jgi:hypothetical protein
MTEQDRGDRRSGVQQGVVQTRRMTRRFPYWDYVRSLETTHGDWSSLATLVLHQDEAEGRWIELMKPFDPNRQSGHWVSTVTTPSAAFDAGTVTRQLNQAVRQAVSELSMRMSAEVVDELRSRVERLETEAAARPTVVQISEAPGLTFAAPLSVSVERIDGGYLAKLPELALWADGFSEAEAIEEIKGMVAELAHELLEHDDAGLGPEPRRWKRLLSRLVRRP